MPTGRHVHCGSLFRCLCIGLFIGLAGLRVGPAVFAGHAKESKSSAETDPARLSVDRIFQEGEFHAKGYGATWAKDSDTFWRLESPSSGSGRDVVRVDALSGEAEVVVPAADLVPPGESNPLSIDSFQWSANEDKLLIFTGSKRVWRRKTRGDYWVYDRTSRVLRKLGGDAPPASLMFAKFSPDGNSVAYVRDRTLWLESLLDQHARCLTPTESDRLIYGTFDWVYEEELSARDGFRWSPDGRSIAFWLIDTTGVPTFTLVNNTDEFYPTIQQFAYPKTGQRNSAYRIGVMSVEDGETKWLPIPGDSREHYLCRMQWDGSDAIVVQQLNRLQNANRMFRFDLKSLKRQVLLTETDEAWVDVHDEWKWLKDRSRFTWISERDGWRHAYLVSADGRQQSLMTPGEFDVIKLLHVDEQSEKALFLASPDAPTQCYLYRVNLDGTQLERLTPEKAKGTHHYQISPTGKLAIHSWSSFGRPPRVELIEIEDHKRLRRIENNRSLRKKLRKLELGRRKFFRVDIGDGIELDAWCIFPTNFDKSRKYPILVHVYGEPAGQTVLDRWGGDRYLWHQMMAQRGYFVLSLDNRGTPSPRGRAWRKAVYRQVGVIAPAEQAKAIRQLLADRSYLDAERVGVWGWSGGGSMALNAIFKYPDLYHTAVSIAPVPNQRHYDTIYQERYMGLPSDNVEGYLQGSPIHFAHQLQGKLLLIHGTGDDNCHYQTTEALINDLVRHHKQFQMMAYPNRTHGIHEGPGTTVHLWSLITEFLISNLPPGPR